MFGRYASIKSRGSKTALDYIERDDLPNQDYNSYNSNGGGLLNHKNKTKDSVFIDIDFESCINDHQNDFYGIPDSKINMSEYILIALLWFILIICVIMTYNWYEFYKKPSKYFSQTFQYIGAGIPNISSLKPIH